MTTPLSQYVKHWYIPLLIGIIYIIAGIIIYMSPLSSFLTMTMLFSVGFFISGIFEIIFAVANRQHLSSWGWTLMSGIIDVVFGVILLSSPGTGALSLALLVSFWVLFRSFLSIGNSIELSRVEGSGWGFQLLFGIFGVIVGTYLLTNPILSGLLLVYMIAFGVLILGVHHIVFSLKLKSLKK